MTRHGRIGGLPFLWAFLIFVAGSTFAMFASNTDWLGSWRQAIDRGAGTVVITGPLLSGLVAGSYASLRRTTVRDLVIVSARRWQGWFGPAIRLWVAAVVSLCALLAVVTVRAQILDVPTPARQFLIVPVAVLVLGVHTLIGLTIGLRASPRVAALLAAGISFGLFLVSHSHLAPPSFTTGGVTGSMYGEQYRVGSVIALCVFAVASAAVLAPWVGWSERLVRVRWGVTVVAVACIVGLAQKTWPDIEARLEAGPVAFRCEQAVLEICLVRERPSDDFKDIATRLDALAEPLRAIGVEVPTRWKYGLYGQPVDLDRGVLFLSGDGELGGRVDDDDLLRSLVEPADCARHPGGTEPASVYGSRALIQGWLATRNGLPAMLTFRPTYPTEKAEAWVRTTYDQLRRCDLDAIRRP